ncbi:MAG: hypothetical protein QG650_1112 [Patescibacteria group bacterium]|nr:hypothetical protein [Patescibacteria group bacterium]
MKNDWMTLFLKPAKTDLLAIQGYALGIAGAWFMAGERAFWFGAFMVAFGLIVNVIIPRAVLMDLEKALAKNPNPNPSRKPLRGMPRFRSLRANRI